MQAARERRPPRSRPAAPALVDPPGYRVRVSPGQAAQPRGGPGQRLVRLAFGSSLEDAGHLSQQVGPAACELAQRGHRGGFLVAGERAPPGPVPRLAGELGYEDPVSLRATIDHTF
jgi:hypothetical protein